MGAARKAHIHAYDTIDGVLFYISTSHIDISKETIYYSKTYRRGDRTKGAPAMLRISTQFPAKLLQRGEQTGRVTVQMLLELTDPFAVSLIILQEDGGYGWALSAEDLTAALKNPGTNFGLGYIKIKREKSSGVVRIILPTGEGKHIRLRCPAGEVEQFVRCANHVITTNDLLAQYLEIGQAAIDKMLAGS